MELTIRLLIMAAISFLLLSSSNMIKFNAACNPKEREALIINFKHNQKDPYDDLWSWVGNDCCKWSGVLCENKTESDDNDWVVELNLAFISLSGELNPSLLELKHLYHLDLSWNNFTGILPAFLGSLQNLRYLNLFNNGFTGKVPPQLGNLSSLYYLRLGKNKLEGEIPTTLGNLCNLEELDLSQNKLQGEISSRLFTNSSTCFGNKLKSLNLGYNYLLSGQLPDELGTLKKLELLYLSTNSFSGSIPMSLGRLSLLRILDLSYNKLNGSLPESFRNLSSLKILYISLEGFLTEANFDNLTRLEVLDIDSLVLNVSRDWVPPFQLREARHRNCSLGQRFPEWLQTQKYLTTVDVSNAGISGSVPSWFWNMTSQFIYLNISHNQIEGELPNMFSMRGVQGLVYMNSNRFTGNLPRISSPIVALDLSKNTFSGPISNLLCYPNTYSLSLLDLSENHLSGELPDCWFYWRSLVMINLQSNNITGKIPSTIGFLRKLETLRLQNNSLHGELPSTLRNCTRLRITDVGENRLTGQIPPWLGESLTRLIVLRLRSNEFNGEIPRKLCYLTKLQLMDLGHNNLSGSIPKCFSNFSTMASKRYSKFGGYLIYTMQNTEDTVDFVVKGKDMVYGQSLLELVAGIDLSSNNLYGEIPEELTFLYALQILNLGKNRFTGKIPNKIGLLSSLESLDLSNNRLSGSIPQSMVNLTFLSYLNLSYNNLSGEIPLGTQLQSFSELSYIGNHDLCGHPLKNCNEDEQQPRKAPNGEGEGSMEDDEDQDWIEMKWFYMGLPFGFVVGFWCLWGVLLVNKSWRYAYLRFLDDIIYSLCTYVKQKKK